MALLNLLNLISQVINCYLKFFNKDIMLESHNDVNVLYLPKYIIEKEISD